MEQEQQKRTPEEQENLQSRAAPQCKYCGCETNADVIKAASWTKIGLILIEDIPARLCEGCGEQFFEEDIAQRIQQVIKYPEAKAKRQIWIPVYSLPKVQTVEKELDPKVPDQQQTASPELTYHQAKQTAEPVTANRDRDETFLCKYCESETVEDLVKSAFWVDGGLLAVENIPARMCRQCRQQFYDNETAEKITTLGKGRFVPGTTRQDVSIPVYSLTDVE